FELAHPVWEILQIYIGRNILAALYYPCGSAEKNVYDYYSNSFNRKYANTTNFAELLNTTVNEIFAQMLTKEGIDRPFKPQSYCHELVMNMFNISVFNHKMDQKMHTNFQYPSHCFGHDISNLYGIYEFIPIARYFMANPLQKLQKTYNKCFEYAINELKLRDNNYDESNGRDFCSQFLDAKRRAEAEEKPDFECFNDNNIAAVIMDMYIAGTDTMHLTLLIMRNEVNDRLGDRAPVVADKHHLHCVMAFIYETIRWRNVGPMGAPHMTLSDTILGGKYKVPDHTILIGHLWHILTNDKYFSNADQFKPERFLDKQAGAATPALALGAGRAGTAARADSGSNVPDSDTTLALHRLRHGTEPARLRYGSGSQPALTAPALKAV
ncbi:unnamed protein product, partial [Medioppia subpectinata]